MNAETFYITNLKIIYIMKKTNKLSLLLFLFFSFNIAKAQSPTVYFLPGQGADERLFSHIELDTQFAVRYIKYSVPDANDSMHTYARKIAKQIDTTEKFILIGTSFGGMLATEMADFLSPEKVIIISSAKSQYELPNRYQFQKRHKLYKWVSPNMTKLGARILQPIVEPDRIRENATFRSMLNDKDPIYMKRSVTMIIEWERTDYNENIIHIHGENDKTVPIRNVDYDILVKNGSHMITLTEGEVLSEILNKLLSE